MSPTRLARLSANMGLDWLSFHNESPWRLPAPNQRAPAKHRPRMRNPKTEGPNPGTEGEGLKWNGNRVFILDLSPQFTAGLIIADPDHLTGNAFFQHFDFE